MDGTIAHGGFNGTVGFVNVHTVVVLAVIHQCPHFGVIMCQFLLADIGKSKFPEAGCIYNFSATGQVKHFCKGGGVHALATPPTYLLGA